jgi:hypothetical protein
MGHWMGPEEIPELMKKLQRQADMHEMARDVGMHEFKYFIEGLDKHQLEWLHKLMNAIGHDASLASLTEGITLTLLQERHNICMACHKDHDQEIKEQSTGPAETKPTMPEGDAIVGETKPVSMMQRQLMSEWQLDDLRTMDFELVAFICTNCEMRYPTIQARIDHGKDNCPGCINKTKWG